MKERDHSENLGRYGKTILKCINSEIAYGLDPFDSELALLMFSCENGTLWFHSWWTVY